MGMYPGGNIIKLTPSDLSASAHTAGDVLFAKNELKNAVPSRGGCSLLRTVTAYIEGAATDDDWILMFFDNSTDLGAAANAAATGITADEFRAASCIGSMVFNGGINATDVGQGLLYSNTDADYGGIPLLIKAADGETSIWVAAINFAGTVDLTDTDSLSLTFGFEYLG